MAELMLRPLSVGEIIDHSLGVYRRQFAPLFFITLLANGIPLILGVYIISAGGILANPVLWFANALLSVALGALATAATVFLVSESYLGRTLGAGEAFGRATKFIWRLILLSIAVTLLVGLGFILLIVPGVIILCGLIVATQALVLEDVTTGEALSRSWGLTKGYRWKMLGLLIVIAIIILIPSAGLAFLMPTPGTPGGIGNVAEVSANLPTKYILWLVTSQLLTILVYPLLYCALTIAYYDLRVRKEGFDLELLESTLAHALPQGRASGSRDLPKPHTFG